MSPALIAAIAVPVLLILIWIGINNSLVNKKNQVENAFGSIDVQLKKRTDLIPNLVAAVKQYMEHEASLLSEITALRSQITNPNSSEEERFQAEGQMTQKLSALNIAVENYPDLKSNTNFLQLQGSLNETEEQISASRRAYNAAVTSYNNGVEMFPSSIIASSKGYKRKAVFEISEAERKNVDVGGLFNS